MKANLQQKLCDLLRAIGQADTKLELCRHKLIAEPTFSLHTSFRLLAGPSFKVASHQLQRFLEQSMSRSDLDSSTATCMTRALLRQWSSDDQGLRIQDFKKLVLPWDNSVQMEVSGRGQKTLSKDCQHKLGRLIQTQCLNLAKIQNLKADLLLQENSVSKIIALLKGHGQTSPNQISRFVRANTPGQATFLRPFIRRLVGLYANFNQDSLLRILCPLVPVVHNRSTKSPMLGSLILSSQSSHSDSDKNSHQNSLQNEGRETCPGLGVKTTALFELIATQQGKRDKARKELIRLPDFRVTNLFKIIDSKGKQIIHPQDLKAFLKSIQLQASLLAYSDKLFKRFSTDGVRLSLLEFSKMIAPRSKPRGVQVSQKRSYVNQQQELQLGDGGGYPQVFYSQSLWHKRSGSQVRPAGSGRADRGG